MPRHWTRTHQQAIGIGLILLLALALRLAALQSFLTIDEQLWALRSQRFSEALHSGRLADTYQTQHPGVVTMWLGTLAIGLGLARSGGDLAGTVFGARWLAAGVNWLGLCLLCWMVWRCLGHRVALLAALLVGLDPFYLAHSRLLHLDALLTTFTTLSLVALWCDLQHPRCGVRWLLLSAVCAGLAVLAKSPGLALFPFGGLVIALAGLRRRQFPYMMGRLALWGAVALLTVVLLWPALWVSPVQTLTRMAQGSLEQGLAPHENENFFLGHPTADPGPLFYPLAWCFRTTPGALLGLAVALWWILRHGDRPVWPGLLMGFVLAFTFLMALGAKKFDRYLLPAFPVVDLLAAWGWARPLALLQTPRRQGVGLVALAVVQAGLVLACYPYYLSYYNPLAGGPTLATRALLVGWGEGMDQAAAYLNQKADASTLRASAWYQPALAPFFQGKSSVLYETDYATDYAIFYINERQRDPTRAQGYCQPHGPEKVIRIHGIDYVWICATDQERQPLVEYLKAHAAPEDVVLLSQPAPRLEARLPGQVWTAKGDPLAIGGRLEQTSGQLWYVQEPYAVEPMRTLDYLLATRCREMGQVRLSLAQVTRYALPPLFPWASTQPEQPQEVAFGQELRLVDSGVAATSLDFRQQVGVTLEWVSVVDQARDLKVAWRVRDAQGRSWGESDHLLVDEAGQEASRWQAGTRHRTRHLIPLLSGLPPGPYHLSLVLYHEPTMQQLPHQEAEGRVQHAPYVLADLEVVPCPIPPTLEELAIPQSRRERGGGLALLGWAPWPQQMQVGESLLVECVWEAQGERRVDADLRLWLQSAEGEVVGQIETPIADDHYPLSGWPQGERIRARYDLPIPSATRPGTYTLSLTWLDQVTAQPLLSSPVQLGPVVIQGRPHQFALPEIAHPQGASLGQTVALLGYSLGWPEVSSGGEMEVTLYWQARGEMTTSYTVFVHLLDSGEKIWGQKDSLPGGGAWPTTGWLTGEILTDQYIFRISPDTPQGVYRLEVGMYDAATGRRLPAWNAQGQPLSGDRVLLETPILVR